MDILINLFNITISTITIVTGYRILSTGTEIFIIVLSPKFDMAKPVRVNIFTYDLYPNLLNVSAKNSEVTTIRPTVVVKQVSIVIAPRNACPKLPKSLYELIESIYVPILMLLSDKTSFGTLNLFPKAPSPIYKLLKSIVVTIPTIAIILIYSFFDENPNVFIPEVAIRQKLTEASASKVLYPSKNPVFSAVRLPAISPSPTA